MLSVKLQSQVAKKTECEDHVKDVLQPLASFNTTELDFGIP